MKERARELKTGDADGENDVLEKIAEMPEADRVIAERRSPSPTRRTSTTAPCGRPRSRSQS
jgi:hypothetical protein